MSTEQQFDMRSGSIPASWHEAALEAPEGDHKPLSRAAVMQAIPTGNKLDLFTAVLAGAAACLVGGYIWYALETGADKPYNLAAIVAGAVIALAVRIGGGRSDPPYRATISLLFYLTATLVVIYAVGRSTLLQLYGESPVIAEIERFLLMGRFAGSWDKATYILGGAVAVLVSLALRPER